MPEELKQFISAVDILNDWVGRSVALGVVVIAAMTAFEVIARFVFKYPTLWAHETVAHFYGFYVIIGGGYVLLHKAHIRVDVFWSRLSPRKQAIIDLVTCGFVFLFLGVLFWFTSKYAWHAIQIREHSITPFGCPIYPLKITMAIGALLILLQLIVKTIRDFHLAISGVESD